MAVRQAELTTYLTVKECADTFRQAISEARGVGSSIGGLAARMMGNDNSGYYTPRDESPFSALDDDKPTFMVGALVPKFRGGADGNGTDIHLYVWDRGSYRDIQFWAPHGFGGGMHAQKLIDSCLQSFLGNVVDAPVADGGSAGENTSAPVAVPAGWHADPYGSFELRYWDGAKWTEHVSTQGEQSTDVR